MKDLFASDIKIGKEFSSFTPDKTTYYDIYSEQMEGLTQKARLEKEGQIMEKIQGDERKFGRYYAIDN